MRSHYTVTVREPKDVLKVLATAARERADEREATAFRLLRDKMKNAGAIEALRDFAEMIDNIEIEEASK